MLPATRPLVRRATQALATRAAASSSTRPAAAAYSSASVNGHNKHDPAIPGDSTGYLPGDKITGDTQIGSYPNLPMYNQQFRDPAGGWWDPQDRRNFGETVPEEDDVLNIWSPDVWAFPAGLGAKRLLTAAIAFLGFGYLVNETKATPHFERRSYPNGLLAELGVDASDEVMVAKRGARVAEE
ncbi:hypothetical protein BGZ98_004569 [Dissophora globulifera]|uniref:Uncharacterized protein n=1 Tax=Dissophora globulifera TaxID=979702 RepID=A0A9P6UYN4_9FUNG|nr:hypothetical protein BGZ98_004569 [Dissophora globulifera]KAG0326420.1 hypothetical protein BGZ99_009561 [Dissophora globulifera]